MKSNLKFAPFIFIILILLLVLANGCTKKGKSPVESDDDDVQGKVKYGETKTYETNVSYSAVLPDVITKETFVFPNGFNGKLTVKKYSSGLTPPAEGLGFAIDLSTGTDIQIEVADESGKETYVWGFGRVNGMYDDSKGIERWNLLAPVKKENGTTLYELLLPADYPAGLRKTTESKIGYTDYWISKLPPDADATEQSIAVQRQISDLLDNLSEKLPGDLKAAFNTNRQRLKLSFLPNDGNYYRGFSWRTTLGTSLGRTVRPTMSIQFPPVAKTITHEAGHYFIHILAGDDACASLEGQAWLFSDHGLYDNVGRDVILEDYAYFIEQITHGDVKGIDLDDPVISQAVHNKNWISKDYPSYEGYKAIFMSALVRDKNTIRDFYSNGYIDIPVETISIPELFRVISRGPVTLTQLLTGLRENLNNNLSKVSVVAQRTGWRYHINGKVLDKNNKPLQGVSVESVCKAEKVYHATPSYYKTPVNEDGSFSMDDIFPGQSTLRIFYNGDSTDVDINIDWNNPTTSYQEVGTFNIEEKEKTDIQKILDQVNTIKISIPLWVTHELTQDNNGVETTQTFENDFIRIDYDRIGSFKMNGLSFTDSIKTSEGNTTTLTKIVGSVSGDFKKISTLSYDYTETTLTNDSNFVSKTKSCTVGDIPFTSANETKIEVIFNVYLTEGMNLVNEYKDNYHSKYTIEGYYKEITEKSTQYKDGAPYNLSVYFEKK